MGIIHLDHAHPYARAQGSTLALRDLSLASMDPSLTSMGLAPKIGYSRMGAKVLCLGSVAKELGQSLYPSSSISDSGVGAR